MNAAEDRGMDSLASALGDMATATRTSTAPRENFRDSLRDRLFAEASEVEVRAADAFQMTLDGVHVNGNSGLSRGTLDEVRAFASFATALAPVAPIIAPAGLRLGLRNQLAVARSPVRSLASARAAKGLGRVKLRFALAAAISMLIGSSALAVVASTNAAPGDTFYNLKRARERVQLWGVSGFGEGLRLLVFADERIDELETLAARSTSDDAAFERALRDLRTQTLAASSLLLTAASDGTAGAATALGAFLEQGQHRLDALAPSLPDSVQSLVDDALITFDDLAERVATITDEPSDPGPEPTPPPSSAPSPEPTDDGQPDIVPRPSDAPTIRPTGSPSGQPTIVPEPTLTPLPEPDRIPNVPGQLDDRLEEPLRRILEDLLSAF